MDTPECQLIIGQCLDPNSSLERKKKTLEILGEFRKLQPDPEKGIKNLLLIKMKDSFKKKQKQILAFFYIF